MEKIYVGMLFSSYSHEFNGYNKASAIQDEKYGYYRQGRVYTTKDKHVNEVNCFNQQDLSFDEMMIDNHTIRFNHERYFAYGGSYSQYEMNRNGLKYTGSNENKFDRIESADAYAVDLNNNGKVDEYEILPKKIFNELAQKVKDKFVQPH